MTFLNVVNKSAPFKKKYLRANRSHVVNKELNKDNYDKIAKIAYKKRRNVCVNILRKSKKLLQ